MGFRGKPPDGDAGEMSARTVALRPTILLSPNETKLARQMRRSGAEPETIAAALGKPLEEVEKALVQMRMPRPETSRGTLNVTLAAHKFVIGERRDDEPMWLTFDRLVDELIRLRALNSECDADKKTLRPMRRPRAAHASDMPFLPGLVTQAGGTSHE